MTVLLALESAKSLQKETIVKVAVLSYSYEPVRPHYEDAVNGFIGDFGFDELEWYRKFNALGLTAGVYEFNFRCMLDSSDELQVYDTEYVGKCEVSKPVKVGM